MSTEAAILGTFSLLLTIINIICIFIAGIFVLKVFSFLLLLLQTLIENFPVFMMLIYLFY